MTRLLTAWKAGDAFAMDRLAPIIYEELRHRAHAYMRRERNGHTLQATAVVHEAFVKLVEMNINWQDRAHFFTVAARQMRRILVDHAKSRSSQKRGRSITSSLDEEGVAETVPATGSGIEVLELDDALQRLAANNPRVAQVVELHYFGGMPLEAVADAMTLSLATVERDMRLAKAWITAQVRPAQRNSEVTESWQ